MKRLSELDYCGTGMTVQRSFVEAHDAYGRDHPTPLTEPFSILWEGRDIITGDILRVPPIGYFRIDFMSCRPTLMHGIDIAIPGGGIVFRGGEISPTLRTWYGIWYDPKLEWVEYPYHAPEGQMLLTTVSERPSGEVERWTGNAGMVVERSKAHRYLYRCSHARSSPPNFEDMVFGLTVKPQADPSSD